MKKLISCLLLAALLFCLAACGGNPAPILSPSVPTPPQAQPLSVEHTVALPECEFYVDFLTLTQEVKPPFPGSWYSYYTAEAGYSYIDLCVSYKNLETTDVRADEILSATAYYSGRYEYSGFAIVEKDNRSDLTYANITSIAPLASEYVHYLIKVPQEVAEGPGSLTVFLRVKQLTFQLSLRQGEDGLTVAPDPSASEKKDGALAIGEKVAIPGKSEFYLEHAQFSKKIVPSFPGSFYNYYEADDGKTYLDLSVAYKSLQGSSVQADSILSATLKYAGKYEYSGHAIIEEEGRSDFTYANITSIAPLETAYLHYLFEVPEEVCTGGGALEILLRIDGNTYHLQVR